MIKRVPQLASTSFAAWLLLAALPAPAQTIPGYPGIEDYDAREVAMLPRYCVHTQLFRDRIPGGNNPAEIQRWTDAMGPAYSAMHHYCWGLMRTNRALFLARDKQTRDFYLSSSIGEFDYVLQRVQPGFALRPEILTKKGENLLKLGNGAAGVMVLKEATDLKPDYWPPYAALSDYFKSSGESSRAREWLDKGLKAAPDSRALRIRLQELDKSGR
jgi:tetratricopeptide (TPR) repeat protein